MQRRSLVVISLLFLSQSCAQFHTGRSFLSEMSRDDSSFYQPNEDFPIVAGDTGDIGITEEERRLRTPKSFQDIAESRHRAVLLDELRTLENEQSDGASKFYERHKHKFSTVSEKIYFLNLPPSERKDYLASRGFLIESRRDIASTGIPYRNDSQEIGLGMTKDQILDNLGQPSRVEIAGNPVYENERWLYNVDGASKYIYFESGLVGGWE